MGGAIAVYSLVLESDGDHPFPDDASVMCACGELLTKIAPFRETHCISKDRCPD